ncbi:MAG: polysaccharide deacetylase family protein [Bacteroidales bacterium]|nr:polysaccharide deacetylase family protein [Bacteroidales bacterium]
MSGAIPNTFTKELPVNRLTYLLATLGVLLVPLLKVISQPSRSPYQSLYGAIIRGDTSRPELALVFTGDEYADGGRHIAGVLAEEEVKAAFFLTGKFYRNPDFRNIIEILRDQGHYLGAHSDQHLLYCSWESRDSLLIDREQFDQDLLANYRVMKLFGISREAAPYFLPPYEWYNDSIALWTRDLGLQLINHSPGTLSHADYTVPGTPSYRGSQEIFRSILEYENSSLTGLNGFILLFHVGTVPERRDKFYLYLENLLKELKFRGYRFKRIDTLLEQSKF